MNRKLRKLLIAISIFLLTTSNVLAEDNTGFTDYIYWGIEDNTLYLSASKTEHTQDIFDAEVSSLYTIMNDVPGLTGKEEWGIAPWQDNEEIECVNILGDKDNRIKLQDFGYFFKGMINLKEINGLEYFDLSMCTNMWSMFEGCESLEEIDVSSFDTSNVIYIYRVFCDCNSLKTIDVSSWDTSNIINMELCFDGCGSLETIDVSSWDTSNVKSIYGLFGGCESLKEVKLFTINNSECDAFYYVFYKCRSLKYLDLSSINVIPGSKISDVFTKCNSLKTIYVNETWNEPSIRESFKDDSTFLDCFNLVGGSGTVYSPDHIDCSYARIDEGESNPGYFTLKTKDTVIPNYDDEDTQIEPNNNDTTNPLVYIIPISLIVIAVLIFFIRKRKNNT